MALPSQPSYQVRVYLEDTDAGGVVYYGNYLKFMERARTEWLRQLGSCFGELHANGLQFVVHSLAINYIKPAFMDDALNVTAIPVDISRCAVSFEQSVLRGQEVICKANVKVVCVASTTLKPSAIPESVNQDLVANLGATQ